MVKCCESCLYYVHGWCTRGSELEKLKWDVSTYGCNKYVVKSEEVKDE